jgi:hypothetical protein
MFFQERDDGFAAPGRCGGHADAFSGSDEPTLTPRWHQDARNGNMPHNSG